MKRKIVIGFLLLQGILLAGQLKAQLKETSVVSTAGNFHLTSAISVSYTIGELAVGSFNASGIRYLEGFQQPVQGVPDEVDDKLEEKEFHAWPNPASSEIFIRFDPEWKEDILVEVYDILGRMHLQQKSEAPHKSGAYRLDINALESGIYILKVSPSGMNKIETDRFRIE